MFCRRGGIFISVFMKSVFVWKDLDEVSIEVEFFWTKFHRSGIFNLLSVSFSSALLLSQALLVTIFYDMYLSYVLSQSFTFKQFQTITLFGFLFCAASIHDSAIKKFYSLHFGSAHKYLPPSNFDILVSFVSRLC